MTPSRSRSNSNAYQQNNRSYTPNVSRVAHKQRTQRSTNAAVLTSPVPVHSSKPPHSNRISTPRKTPIPPADVGMSPASRYNSNLRVLRRRDHTIVSVFDQFPHVCMYHHNKAAGKWEKKGYEGTFFLFEREIEPKYGFYILNRMGMDDYIQYVLPNDSISVEGEFITYQSFRPHSAIGRGDSDDEDSIVKIIGLWMLAMDSRDSLADVLKRLLACIREGRSYPEEYRYGPDRVPPLTFTSHDEDEDEDTSEGEDELDRSSNVFRGEGARIQKASIQAKKIKPPQPSELDQLFAKLTASTQPDAIDTPPTNQNNPISTAAPSGTTANSILDMLSKGSGFQPPPPAPFPQPAQPLRGMALLDTMFASVSSTDVGDATLSQSQSQYIPQTNGLPKSYTHPSLSQFKFPLPPSEPLTKTNTITPPQDMEILSPKPSSAALPQILTASVIQELMGLPTSMSRSTSRISTSTSEQSPVTNYPGPPYSQSQQRPRPPSSVGARGSKERGYIADRGEDDGGISEASTGIEIEASDLGVRGSQLVGSRSAFLSATNTGSTGTQKGDATPRARMEDGLELVPMISSPPKASRPGLTQAISESTVSSNAGPGGKRKANGAPSASGTRVVSAPSTTTRLFQADYDLWPSASTSAINGGSKPDESDDVVELDFSEIQVLDDMKSFQAKSNGRSESKAKGKGKPESGATRQKDKAIVAQHSVPPTLPSKAQNAKQPKKDRENEKHKANAAANDSTATKITSPASTVRDQPMTSTSTSSLNGSASAKSSSGLISAPVSPELAKHLLLKSIAGVGPLSAGSTNARASTGPVLEKNAFIREVLTLIHTDKSFVENLYQAYVNTA